MEWRVVQSEQAVERLLIQFIKTPCSLLVNI